jgi:2-polyprenyl-6-hydroxyphenyl methylase/3-demethylubiquinone-9 3-methyltransferase
VAGTVDRAELDKFQAMAARWWDPHGPLRPLHFMNPVRIDWLLRQCRAHLAWAGGRRPLTGLAVLDVGCGGGLLAEPLARLGATVTGIDPEPANLEVAAEHARAAGLAIDYRAATAEEVAAEGRRFDLVTALEVVEHVPDPDAFVRALAATTRPGGLVVLSTLSRTLAAWVAAIVAAEYLLGWLPKGTHAWGRFLKPSELAARARAAGLRPVGLTGLAYEPAYERFTTSRDPAVNYMLAAVRDPVGGSA